ncbi:hypothetical protein D9M68_912220 [compost metagenome]
MIEVTAHRNVSVLQTLPEGETSCGEGLCMPPASLRFPIYLGTRRVVLPTRCCYKEQQCSGDLRQLAYELWMLAQDTDQDGSLIIGR